jgi:hypothetical protein
MEFIATSSVGSDETQSFDVRDYKGTFGEFVKEVLTKYKSEWGEFKIKNTAWFVPSSFEYKHGELLNEIPQDLLDKKIVKVQASGGWSNMDYYLYLEDYERMSENKAAEMAWTNETKAAKIAEICNCGMTHDAWYDDFKRCALDAMEWKQSEIEKWLEVNIYDYMYKDDDDTTCIDIQRLIKDLRKTY